MRLIGLHVRVTDPITAAAQRAIDLDLPIFQCFFLHQTTNRLIDPQPEEVAQFVQMRTHFKKLFVHASYWTNFASVQNISMRSFKMELKLAKQLGFDQIIIHPGSAKGAQNRMEGIDALVRRLNRVLKYEHEIGIVLENTAHANLSIGGDFYDMKTILEKSDYPEKLSFCIDTAHAHVYGYHIAELQDQQSFFVTIAETIGFDRIALIHLNNTNQLVGSRMDRHVLLEQGVLSTEALKAFMFHPAIAHVPIIMELPIVDEQAERETIRIVKSWHNNQL